MKIQGSYPFATTPGLLWPHLLNADVLCQVMPGCQKLAPVGANEYQGQILIRLGPLAGLYQGTLTLSEVQPGMGYAFRFMAQSENGGLNGNGRLHLEDQEGLVYLHYALQADASGGLREYATPLLETAARSIARQSLERLGQFVQSNRLESVASVLGDGATPPKAPAWRDVRQPAGPLSPRQSLYAGCGRTAVFLLHFRLRHRRATNRS